MDVQNLYESIQPQTMDNKRQCSARTVRKENYTFPYDADGVFIRVSAIDRASQRYVPAVLRPRLLRLCYYSLLAGHLGERRMYDSLRWEFYWPPW